MGDMGDYWREHREYKQGVKAKRRGMMSDVVDRVRNQGYTITKHNDGEHIKIHLAVGVVDYWPSTGRFCHGKKTGFGIKKLITYLQKIEPTELELEY